MNRGPERQKRLRTQVKDGYKGVTKEIDQWAGAHALYEEFMLDLLHNSLCPLPPSTTRNDSLALCSV